jgi:hypothetical protein
MGGGGAAVVGVKDVIAVFVFIHSRKRTRIFIRCSPFATRRLDSSGANKKRAARTGALVSFKATPRMPAGAAPMAALKRHAFRPFCRLVSFFPPDSIRRGSSGHSPASRSRTKEKQ